MQTVEINIKNLIGQLNITGPVTDDQIEKIEKAITEKLKNPIKEDPLIKSVKPVISSNDRERVIKKFNDFLDHLFHTSN